MGNLFNKPELIICFPLCGELVCKEKMLSGGLCSVYKQMQFDAFVKLDLSLTLQFDNQIHRSIKWESFKVNIKTED